MTDLSVTSEWKFHGLDTIIFENRFLRVVLLPGVGGKIWQISYKPFDVPLLWNNPRIVPRALPMNSRYDDVWCGGWDELFPNDELATIGGEAYPDHGELWTGAWKAETFQNQDEAGVRLTFVTPLSAIRIAKTITLQAGESKIHFEHKFTNIGGEPFPFLWKLHPAFAISPKHRIDFPSMKVLLEPTFLGTLAGAANPFAWPHAQVGSKQVDLRRVPTADERQLYFFYGTEMKDSWCALTNTETGLACGLHFDPRIFGSCWLFASYGGWRNYHVAVLEPCTGYPLDFEVMHNAGRACVLGPSASLATKVLFSAQEKMQSVGKVHPDGTMETA